MLTYHTNGIRAPLHRETALSSKAVPSPVHVDLLFALNKPSLLCECSFPGGAAVPGDEA